MSDGWIYRVQWCQFHVDNDGREYLTDVKRLELYDEDEQGAREYCRRLAQENGVRDVELARRRPAPRWEPLQLEEARP